MKSILAAASAMALVMSAHGQLGNINIPGALNAAQAGTFYAVNSYVVLDLYPTISTSTVLSTSIHTIFACPPEKTDCPLRKGGTSTTTSIVVVSTSLCPTTYVSSRYSAVTTPHSTPPVYGSSSQPVYSTIVVTHPPSSTIYYTPPTTETQPTFSGSNIPSYPGVTPETQPTYSVTNIPSYPGVTTEIPPPQSYGPQSIPTPSGGSYVGASSSSQLPTSASSIPPVSYSPTSYSASSVPVGSASSSTLSTPASSAQDYSPSVPSASSPITPTTYVGVNVTAYSGGLASVPSKYSSQQLPTGYTSPTLPSTGSVPEGSGGTPYYPESTTISQSSAGGYTTSSVTPYILPYGSRQTETTATSSSAPYEVVIVPASNAPQAGGNGGAQGSNSSQPAGSETSGGYTVAVQGPAGEFSTVLIPTAKGYTVAVEVTPSSFTTVVIPTGPASGFAPATSGAGGAQQYTIIVPGESSTVTSVLPVTWYASQTGSVQGASASTSLPIESYIPPPPSGYGVSVIVPGVTTYAIPPSPSPAPNGQGQGSSPAIGFTNGTTGGSGGNMSMPSSTYQGQASQKTTTLLVAALGVLVSMLLA